MNVFSFMMILSATVMLSACGSGGSDTTQVPNYQGYENYLGVQSCQGTCPTPDLVQTSVGCLPQAGCGACMGLDNGACIAAIPTLQNGTSEYPGETIYPGEGGFPDGDHRDRHHDGDHGHDRDHDHDGH